MPLSAILRCTRVTTGQVYCWKGRPETVSAVKGWWYFVMLQEPLIFNKADHLVNLEASKCETAAENAVVIVEPVSICSLQNCFLDLDSK